MRQECDLCKAERAARHRVVHELPDPRFREPDKCQKLHHFTLIPNPMVSMMLSNRGPRAEARVRDDEHTLRMIRRRLGRRVGRPELIAMEQQSHGNRETDREIAVQDL